MALPNSPFAGTNKGPAPQSAKPNPSAQLGVSTIKRRTGFNINGGYTLPFGAGWISTKLFHAQGQTVALHTYLYKGETKNVAIPVKTVIRRGGTVSPVKLAPQTVEGF